MTIFRVDLQALDGAEARLPSTISFVQSWWLPASHELWWYELYEKLSLIHVLSY